jgi:superfamily II DNA or RNA helicase
MQIYGSLLGVTVVHSAFDPQLKLKMVQEHKCGFLVVNHDLFQNHVKQEDILRDYLKFDFLIVDEAHHFKTEKT